MKVIVATGNAGKMREFKRILEPLGFQVTSMKEEGIDVPIRRGRHHLCGECPHQGHDRASAHRRSSDRR